MLSHLKKYIFWAATIANHSRWKKGEMRRRQAMDNGTHLMLSTQSVTASNGRPHKYIIIYCTGTLLPYLGGGLRGWWRLALWVEHLEWEQRRENFIKLSNNLHASIYSKSGAHRPCLVLFGNNTSLGITWHWLVMDHGTWAA
jgi:hypothetical protein